MSRPIDKVVEALRAQGCKPKKSGKGYAAKCPVHDGKDFDSLSVTEAEDGKVLVRCQSKNCPFDLIVESVGLSKSDFFPDRTRKNSQSKKGNRRSNQRKEIAEYRYLDEAGEHRFSAIRYQPKKFNQCRPDGDRGRVWGLHSGWYERRPNGKNWTAVKGNNKRARPKPKQQGGVVDWFDDIRPILYRLPQVLSADYGDWVFVVEGEKDVDNLINHDLIATTCPQGAKKWCKIDDSPLQGRKVAILPDNDADGMEHAQLVARSLIEKTKCVRVVELSGLRPRGDVSDWLEVGHSKDELLALVGDSPDWVPTKDSPLTLNPSAPFKTAQAFARRYPARTGGSSLVFHRGSFFRWNGTHYKQIDEDSLRAELYPFLEISFDDDGRPFNPNRNKLADVIDALRGQLGLRDNIDPPTWLDERDEPHPSSVLCCSNGIVNLLTGEVIQPTPELFALNALDYSYDPDAPPPERWLKFLNELWPGDPESALLLQEWFGYCLTTDTSQQKILVIVGPRRAGKSTIGRALTALVGSTNVTSPGLNEFSTEFGLQCLIDKPVAILADVRASKWLDQGRVLERLLRISGEDRLTINRKYKHPWEGRLPTRLVMITNEMPTLSDTSAAFTYRLLVLQLTRSWAENEDTTLEKKLLKERPGILNWSLEGLRHLRSQGRFTEPESSRVGKEEIQTLSSPISRFVEDRCELGLGKEVAIDDLFNACNLWLDDEGMSPIESKQLFGKQLRIYAPSVKRRRKTTTKPAGYQGISLKT